MHRSIFHVMFKSNLDLLQNINTYIILFPHLVVTVIWHCVYCGENYFCKTKHISLCLMWQSCLFTSLLFFFLCFCSFLLLFWSICFFLFLNLILLNIFCTHVAIKTYFIKYCYSLSIFYFFKFYIGLYMYNVQNFVDIIYSAKKRNFTVFKWTWSIYKTNFLTHFFKHVPSVFTHFYLKKWHKLFTSITEKHYYEWYGNIAL